MCFYAFMIDSWLWSFGRFTTILGNSVMGQIILHVSHSMMSTGSVNTCEWGLSIGEVLVSTKKYWKNTERKQYSMGDCQKKTSNICFFTKNQTHSRWFRQKINSSRSRNELCRSYYGYHICSLKFPQGSKHLQTMVMDGKCFTQEVIGHPNHHVRLDAYGCPLYLVNGLSHPHISVGCLRPVNRWVINQLTNYIVRITSSRTS